MPNSSESAQAPNNSKSGASSTRFPRSFGKQAYLPISEKALYQVTFNLDFATKICKVRNCVYLCNARPMQVASQSTYSNAIKRCPLSTSAMQLCRSRKLNGGNASFLHTYFNF